MSIRLTDDEVWAMLEAQRVGIFTSLRRDGSPISLPVWYAPIDRRIYLRGPSRSRKFVRVQNNSRVAFLCETGERWMDLRAVHLTGSARVVHDFEIETRVAEALDRRYEHLRPTDRLPDATSSTYRTFCLIEMVPDDRILSWDNSRLG